MKSILIPKKAPQAIREKIQEDKLTAVTIETGNENIYIPKEHKFIVTKGFLTDIVNVFNHCNTLRTINMENFDFSKITTMQWWFCGCCDLKEIIFPKIAYCNKLKDLRLCFGHTKLQSIDLSFMSFENNNESVHLIQTFYKSKAKKIKLPKCEISCLAHCFSLCYNVEEIIAPITFDLLEDDSLFETFEQCKRLKLVDLSKGYCDNEKFIAQINNTENYNHLTKECVVILPEFGDKK